MSEHRIVDIGPLLKKLRNDFPVFNPNSDPDLMEVSEAVASEIMDLEELPVIDPGTLRPVGHWVRREDRYDGVWDCSVCGKSVGQTIVLCSKYCLNCGAKMEKGNRQW